MVTGAAGFIGSHFVDYVLKNHPEDMIIGFDSLTYAGNMDNLQSALSNNRFKFVKGDIRNPTDVNSVVANVDAIINFAAESHVDRSISSSKVFVETNVSGVNTLLEASINNKIKIFHQISTDEVYGSVLVGDSSENDKLNPRSPYAASKAAADLLAESYRTTHGINLKISRACNNFGSRQFPEKIIPFFITRLLNNQKVPIYGDGKQIRDWIHVSDHVKAVDLIFRSSIDDYIFNIGGSKKLNNIELTKKLLDLLNINESYIEYVEDRKGHDFRYSMNSDLIEAKLNFKPNLDFEKKLQETVDGYKKIHEQKNQK